MTEGRDCRVGLWPPRNDIGDLRFWIFDFGSFGSAQDRFAVCDSASRFGGAIDHTLPNSRNWCDSSHPTDCLPPGRLTAIAGLPVHHLPSASPPSNVRISRGVLAVDWMRLLYAASFYSLTNVVLFFSHHALARCTRGSGLDGP
jgi:hypothetical protein